MTTCTSNHKTLNILHNTVHSWMLYIKFTLITWLFLLSIHFFLLIQQPKCHQKIYILDGFIVVSSSEYLINNNNMSNKKSFCPISCHIDLLESYQLTSLIQYVWFYAICICALKLHAANLICSLSSWMYAPASECSNTGAILHI